MWPLQNVGMLPLHTCDMFPLHTWGHVPPTHVRACYHYTRGHVPHHCPLSFDSHFHIKHGITLYTHHMATLKKEDKRKHSSNEERPELYLVLVGV